MWLILSPFLSGGKIPGENPEKPSLGSSIGYGVAFVSKIKIDLLDKIDWQIDSSQSAKCRSKS